MEALQTLTGLLWKGGIFMVPLGIVALAALVLIVERLFYLRENKIDTDAFHYHLRNALKDRELEQAIVLSAKTKGMIGRVMEEALRKVQQGAKDVDAASEKAILNEMEGMEKSRGWLATLIHVSPLIGIVGTVYGMIVAFMNIEQSGSADPALLAGGIYQALVTTFAGLLIAILASFAQEHIRRESNRLLYHVDLYVAEVREWLGGYGLAEAEGAGSVTERAGAKQELSHA